MSLADVMVFIVLISPELTSFSIRLEFGLSIRFRFHSLRGFYATRPAGSIITIGAGCLLPERVPAGRCSLTKRCCVDFCERRPLLEKPAVVTSLFVKTIDKSAPVQLAHKT